MKINWISLMCLGSISFAWGFLMQGKVTVGDMVIFSVMLGFVWGIFCPIVEIKND